MQMQVKFDKKNYFKTSCFWHGKKKKW